MTVHASRRREVKLLVAAMVASAAVAIVPAGAAVGTPSAMSNTFEMGYTNNPFVVAVGYSASIDGGASTVTVTDGDGNPVAGSDYVVLTAPNALVFQTNASNPFTEDGSPYTATFVARAIGQAGATPSAEDTFVFDVDFITPFPPNVWVNDPPGTGPAALDIEVIGPGDAIVIRGSARDTLSEAGNASGVAKVTLHFYNPLANPTSLTTGGAPEAFRHTVAFPCDPACNIAEGSAEAPLEIQLPEGLLSIGYWNIKASVTDAAGNPSSQGEAMRVLVLG